MTATTRERRRRATLTPAAVFLALFTGLLAFYALCAAGVITGPRRARAGDGALAWKLASSLGALLCFLADAVIVSILVLECQLKQTSTTTSRDAAEAAAAGQLLLPPPPQMDVC